MDEISYRPPGATDTTEHKGGSVIAAHVHHDDQIVYVSSGLISVTTSSGVWSATPDRAVLTPAGMWHEHRAFGNSRVHALELTDTAHFEHGADVPIVFAVDGLLRALLIELTAARIPAELAGQAKALLMGLVAIAPPAGIRLPKPRDERLARVCAMVEADLRQNIPLAVLAAAAHMSERSLSRLFRREFGATYPQWRSLVRVGHPERVHHDLHPVDRADADGTLDFVVHGEEGLAGPWAANARPGDVLHFSGPGGGYAPDPQADWHLLVGDETALPAIAAALEQLPAHATAQVFVEVADAAEEQSLIAPPGATVTWLHRGQSPVGALLVHALTHFAFPAGTPHAFVHGEAGFVKELRRLPRVERALPLGRLSVSGYWRLGHDEDGWQSSKREWERQAEGEQEADARAAS